MRGQIIFFIFLLLSLKGISQGNTDYNCVIESYNTKIEKIVKSGSIKGMSIALIDGNKIVWLRNYGYSDYENKIKVNSNTLYAISTGVNLFTSTSIMQLYEQRRLDIYESARKYCPEFNIKQRYCTKDTITIIHLLSHRSGLPSDLAINRYSKNSLSPNSIRELLQKEYAPYPPNYIFSYSNIGYYLLTDILENVTGNSYKDCIESNIFKPLKMNSSCFTCEDSLIISKGYDQNNELRIDYNLISGSQNAMIKSNINDMAKFTMSFFPDYKGVKILKKKTVTEMFGKELEGSLLDFNKKYGLTWKYERINTAGQIYYHVSKSLNHRCLYAIAPESNLAVVFLTNSINSGPMHDITMNLLDTCAILKGQSKIKKELHKDCSLSDTIIINNEILEKYTGYFANPKFVFEINVKQNNLRTKFNGNKFILSPITDNTFLAQIVLPDNKKQLVDHVKFKFVTDKNSDLFIYQNFKNGQNRIIGVKFIPQKIDSLWTNRLGNYELYEPNSFSFFSIPTFELSVKNGVLVFNTIENSNKWSTALSVKDNNIAFTLGFGNHMGHTLRFEEENDKEILYYSGFKLIRKTN